MYNTAHSKKLLSAILISSLAVASCSFACNQCWEEKKSGWFSIAMKIVSPFTGVASGLTIRHAFKKCSGSTKWLTLGVGAVGAIVSTYWFARFLQESDFSGPSYDQTLSERELEELREYEMAQLSVPKPCCNAKHDIAVGCRACSKKYIECVSCGDKIDFYCPKCKPLFIDEDEKKNKSDEKETEESTSGNSTSSKDSSVLEKPFSAGLTDFLEDPLGW